MKKIIYLLIVLVFTACNSGNQSKTDSEDATIEVAETTINIGGMHCDMCVASVEKGVNALEGIAEVKVSLSDSNAVVKFDKSKVQLAEIEEAIVKRGYKIK